MKKCLVLLVTVLAVLFVKADDRYLSYDEFLRMVRCCHIQSVALDNFSSITGETVENGQTNSFRSFGNTGTANDPLLLQLLKENGVSISIQNRTESNFKTSIVTGVLFLVFPLILLLLLLRVNRKLNLVLRNQIAQQRGGEERR